MKSYNDEYYIVLREDSRDSSPAPSTRSDKKPLSLQSKLALDIQLNSLELIVPSIVADDLLARNISRLRTSPTNRDDAKAGRQHQKITITFTEHFDCWDRRRSTLDNARPVIEKGGELHKVLRYSLNDELLDKTPLEQRLLFRLGGLTNAAYLVCHESIRDYFHNKKFTGLRFVPIADFEAAHDIYGAERTSKKEHKPPRWALIPPFLVTAFLLPMVIPGIIGLLLSYRRLKKYTAEPVKWFSRMICLGLMIWVALLTGGLIFYFVVP